VASRLDQKAASSGLPPSSSVAAPFSCSATTAAPPSILRRFSGAAASNLLGASGETLLPASASNLALVRPPSCSILLQAAKSGMQRFWCSGSAPCRVCTPMTCSYVPVRSNCCHFTTHKTGAPALVLGAPAMVILEGRRGRTIRTGDGGHLISFDLSRVLLPSCCCSGSP
jgi:hypothetical protein